MGEVRLYGREVLIAFDADVMVNPNVQKALQGLAAFLRERGALVKYLLWPESYRGTKTGIDDYLAEGGKILDLYKRAQEYPDAEAIPVGIMLSEVQAETVEWLWERRIPLGKITILDGDPGLGKSLLTTDLAARVTAGAYVPYGVGKFPSAGVVMLAAEDDPGDTILPRFNAAGGDPSKVVLLGTEEMLGLASDLPTIERATKQVQARLVVIDPLMAHFDEDINSNSDKEVRRALMPLKHLAARTGAAILLVRHPNKMPGQHYLYRGGGSIGIIGTARSGLLVGPHPDNEELRVLAGQKSNLGRPPEGLAYRIVTAPNGSAAIRYEGTVELKPQELLKVPLYEEERSALGDAKHFLRVALAEGQKKEATALKKEALSVGISEKTLYRAKNSLGVKSEKSAEVWFWCLPTGEEDTDDPGGGERDLDHEKDAGAKVAKKEVDHLGHLPSSDENSGPAGNMAKVDRVGLFGQEMPSTTANTEKKAYLSQDGQHGQDGHGDVDTLHTVTPQVTDVAGGEYGQHGHQDGQDTEVDHLPYVYVTTGAALEALVDELRETTAPVALDTETYDPNLAVGVAAEEGEALDVRVARVQLIQVKTSEGTPHVVDTRFVGPAPLLEALAEKHVIMHNAAYDLAVLRTNFGYVHRGPISDTMFAAQVFYAGTTNKADLQGLLQRLLEVTISKEEQTSNWGGDLLPAQLNYAAADVEHLHELHEVLCARVRKANLGAVVDLENKMVKVTSEMTALGMPVDEEVFAECVRESREAAAAQLEVLDAFVTASLPEKFLLANAKNRNVPNVRNTKVNWSSPEQVKWALGAAGLQVVNTNKKALAELDHPLVAALRELRRAGDVNRHFRETKVEGGRVHAKWKQIEAKTGRMACERPPMQGVPGGLRRAFVAPAGHKLIVSGTVGRA